MSIISQHFSAIYCKMHKKEKPFGFSFLRFICYESKPPD